MSREKRRKRDRFFCCFTHGRPSASRPCEPVTRTTQQSTPTAPLPANDTVHIQVENEGEGQPVPTATSNTEAQSLWSRAVKGLPSEEQTLLAGNGIDTSTCQLQVVSDIIEGIVKKQNGNDWKFPFNGEQIVMRDIGMKILQWADRFKRIGDIILQYDPGHIALPWAGFRFLLQVKLTFLFCPVIAFAVSAHGGTRLAAESCRRSYRTLADGGRSSAWKGKKHWMRSCLELRRLPASYIGAPCTSISISAKQRRLRKTCRNPYSGFTRQF